MPILLLALQARILLVVGIGWIAIGLYLGYDPAVVAARAAVGSVVVMWLTGVWLRMVGRVIEDRAAADMAERELAAAKAATPALPPTKATPVAR